MEPFTYFFLFYIHLVGYVKPFLYILVIVLYVMRWVCETLFYMFLVFVLYVTRWVC